MRRFLTLLALGVAAQTASAQELVLGAGYSRYNGNTGVNSAVFSVELQGRKLFRFAGADVAPAVSADVHRLGDAHVGVGLAARWALGPSWFIDASVLPGYYRASRPANDLGSRFEIRSTLAAGYRIAPGQAVSLALMHKSNASTGRINPGMNTALLRWHRSF